MEMIYFTIAAVGLYVLSDWILNQIEIKRGERLANRSVVFFFIIISLSVITFAAIQTFLYTPEETAVEETTQIKQSQAPEAPVYNIPD